MSKKIEETVNLKNNSNIDLSNVANIEAIERKGDKDFAKNLRAKSGSRFIPTEFDRIALPSLGIPYRNITNDPDVQEGYIVIREMKGADEKILSTQRFIKDGSVLKRIVSNCIQSDISAEDLVTFDFNYILFALRRLSYGDDYKFKQKCSNSFCEKEIIIDCKISELKFNTLEEDFEEPIVIKLPKSKYTIEQILPRQYHIDEVRKTEMNTKKAEFDADKILITRMMMTTTRICSEDGKEVDKKYWEEFYNELGGMDLGFIREKTNLQTDLEGKEVICPYCNETQKVSVPMGADFFRL